MLNERQKKALILNSKGKTYDEIATVLGTKEKSVADVLQRAQKNLNKNIRNVEFAIENHLLNNEQISSIKKQIKKL